MVILLLAWASLLAVFLAFGLGLSRVASHADHSAGRAWRVRRSEVDRALLSDASPAYVRQEASSPPSSAQADALRTAAPRQIADHIMTVGPGPAEPS